MGEKINLILPFVPVNPGGGSKIMLEYANRLSDKGYDVCIYYPSKVPYLHFRIPALLKYIYYRYLKSNPIKWFSISPQVKQRFIYQISNSSIRDADIIMSTWWSVLFDIQHLSSKKGRRYNFVQDIEYWTGNTRLVDESYKLKGQINITIADFISKHIFNITGVMPQKIILGLDREKFFLSNNISNRNPNSVIMMYSEEERKGSKYGLAALEMLQERFQDLDVKLFSSYERPATIPKWMEYHYKPDNLRKLYNQAAIFITPSLFEGLGLPPMEAMLCGCSVICTDVGGHHEFAVNNVNAIIVGSGVVSELYESVSMLLTNHKKRIDLAEAGYKSIQNYTWEKSVESLTSLMQII